MAGALGRSGGVRANGGGAQPGAGRKPGSISAGTPQERREIADQAKAYGPAALATLAQVMGDSGAPPAARVSASQALLDRGYGKAPQSLAIGGADGGPLQIEIVRFGAPVTIEGAALVTTPRDGYGYAPAVTPVTAVTEGPAMIAARCNVCGETYVPTLTGRHDECAGAREAKPAVRPAVRALAELVAEAAAPRQPKRDRAAYMQGYRAKKGAAT